MTYTVLSLSPLLGRQGTWGLEKVSNWSNVSLTTLQAEEHQAQRLDAESVCTIISKPGKCMKILILKHKDPESNIE